MFERFTRVAREVVGGAQDEARQLGAGHIGTEHLLLAMLQHGSGLAHAVLTGAGLSYTGVRESVRGTFVHGELDEEDAAALRAIGIDLAAVRARLEESFDDGPTEAGQRRLPFTPRAKKVLELGLREATRLRHPYIGTEHLLLGLIRDGEGLAAKVIVAQGVDLADLRAATHAAIARAA